MFVYLLCLDTLVCHSIGYTFYDQSLCLLCSVIVRYGLMSGLTSLGFPDISGSSVRC